MWRAAARRPSGASSGGPRRRPERLSLAEVARPLLGRPRARVGSPPSGSPPAFLSCFPPGSDGGPSALGPVGEKGSGELPARRAQPGRQAGAAGEPKTPQTLAATPRPERNINKRPPAARLRGAPLPRPRPAPPPGRDFRPRGGGGGGGPASPSIRSRPGAVSAAPGSRDAPLQVRLLAAAAGEDSPSGAPAR
ncbi:Triple Functional Domain Protein [Manis pentadactyla]|nr:Triple Functional Domain Protein [Manis pentadactyla]